MSKNNFLNISLLIFILVLITVVVYEPGKDVAITPTILTNIESKDVYHIKINRRSTIENEKVVELKKKDDGWIMLKPYSVYANNFRIDSILKILSATSFSQNDLRNLDLKTFGLNDPTTTITFNNKTSIVFGHNKSLKNHRYIQVGSTLHMLADTFLYQLAAKSESYINHKLFNKKNKIVKLILPSMQLKKINSSWQASKKVNGFSADAANQLINEWQLSQAYDVNKVKPTPNSQPDVIMQLDNDNELRFRLETRKDSFNLVNIDAGIRYILSSDRKDKLLKLSSITASN